MKRGIGWNTLGVNQAPKGLLHLLFESNIFSFFKDIIDNIIETSVLRD